MDIVENFKTTMREYDDIRTKIGKKRIYLFLKLIIIAFIVSGIAYLKEGKIPITLSVMDFYFLAIIISGVALIIDFGNELKNLQYSKLIQHENQLNYILDVLGDIENKLSQCNNQKQIK